MDIQLHYAEYGSGQPLVMLHGNGEDSSYFAAQVRFFQDEYRVITPDTRWHGESPRGTAPFSLSQFADDLNDFLDVLGVESVHLLGFSDGGNIALLFALKYPERVRSLILNGANLYPEGLTDQTRRGIDVEYRAAVAFENERNQAILRLMIDEPHIDPAQLASLNMPTLVVAGDDDMILDEHTRLIAASIPGAQLAILHGTHFVAAENPQDFNRVVNAFLKELP